jgi:2,4-dienoyl-CoA reductase-like NADH-dependent reductase (Old Yellow Enzyme family)/thioredoxin reductase
MFEALFEPVKIGSLELKNRVVVPALSTLTANPDGSCVEQYIAYHEAKARGGWGLIIAEYFGVSPTSGFFPRLFGLWNDQLIENHRRLTERVHACGGKIAAQVNHSGRQTASFITGEQPVGPSAVRDPSMPEVPKALTREQIREIVERFGDTALAVKKAGYDAVELYGAHGFLISNFLSRSANLRTDEYGGPIEGRCRFVVEIIRNIRRKVGTGYPILMRMSTEEFVPGGLTLGETKAIAIALEQAGIDAIDCSQGVYSTSDRIVPPTSTPLAAFVENAAEIKKVVNVPVIAVGRINDPYVAEAVLRSGKADLVAMGRASLADPQFLNKVRAGNLDDILYCIGCNQGCIDQNGLGKPMRCLVNPLTGRESEIELTPVRKRKKILVAGGGVTGCEAALIAAQRGHEIALFEKSDSLGGLWNLAALPPGRAELLTFVRWQRLQLNKHGVKVMLNCELTPQIVKEEKPDAVIIATGSRLTVPPLDGINGQHVVLATDVLRGDCTVGRNVVILSCGGPVAALTGEYLHQYGSNVTIVETHAELARNVGRETRLVLLENLEKNEIPTYAGARLKEVTSHSVTFEHQGREHKLEGIDTVVVVPAAKPLNELEAPVRALGVPVVVVGAGRATCRGNTCGSCFGPGQRPPGSRAPALPTLCARDGLHNIYEGFMAGLQV